MILILGHCDVAMGRILKGQGHKMSNTKCIAKVKVVA